MEYLGFDVVRPPRNPPWAEEELILALDLYLRSGLLDDTAPAVIDLSHVLSDLTVHSKRPDAVRFRNPNGVAMKLANFAAIDPNYHGRGLTRAGRLDAEVWDRYASDEDALTAIAAAIREGRGLPAVQIAEPTHAHVVEAKLSTLKSFKFTSQARTLRLPAVNRVSS